MLYEHQGKRLYFLVYCEQVRGLCLGLQFFASKEEGIEVIFWLGLVEMGISLGKSNLDGGQNEMP